MSFQSVSRISPSLKWVTLSPFPVPVSHIYPLSPSLFSLPSCFLFPFVKTAWHAVIESALGWMDKTVSLSWSYTPALQLLISCWITTATLMKHIWKIELSINCSGINHGYIYIFRVYHIFYLTMEMTYAFEFKQWFQEVLTKRKMWWGIAATQACERLKQEGYLEFKTSRSYIVRSYL